jgi:hypothetical protein
MYDMFESDLRQEYTGIEVMFLHVHAGQAIHMREKLVRAPADLAGMKLRIPTRTGAWIIEALGATPVSMPVPELPQALQKGVVDGALIPWEIIPPLKIQEQTQYQTEGTDKIRFGTSVFVVPMNKDRWDAAAARHPAGLPRCFDGRVVGRGRRYLVGGGRRRHQGRNRRRQRAHRPERRGNRGLSSGARAGDRSLDRGSQRQGH